MIWRSHVVGEGKSHLRGANSVKHVSAQKKSRIIGEVESEGGRIWRDYCIKDRKVNFFVFFKPVYRVPFQKNGGGAISRGGVRLSGIIQYVNVS